MIRTLSAKCPKCNKSNAFNVPYISPAKKVSDIDVPWFQCSFCFQISPSDNWRDKCKGEEND